MKAYTDQKNTLVDLDEVISIGALEGQWVEGISGTYPYWGSYYVDVVCRHGPIVRLHLSLSRHKKATDTYKSVQRYNKKCEKEGQQERDELIRIWVTPCVG